MKLEDICFKCRGMHKPGELGEPCPYCKDGYRPTPEGEKLLEFIQKYLCVRTYTECMGDFIETLSRR